MTTINPPPIPRLPSEWFSNPDIRSYQDAINKIIFQLWVNSPGGTLGDPAEVNDVSFIIGGLYSDLYNELDSYYTHSISSNYTTIGNEFIQVTALCTITLNATPDDQETVYIQPTDNFLLTISGSINGESVFYMKGAYDLMVIKYYIDFGEWRIT